MKVLTLHQPWASLIALGVKTIETRPNRTNVRGRIAIHAAARPAEVGVRIGDFVTFGSAASQRLEERPFMAEPQRSYCTHPLPLGAIVATAELVDCVPMVDGGDEGAIRTLDIDANGSLWIVEAQTDEEADDGAADCREVTDQLPYGHFAPGRWAWILEDVEPLAEPVPFRGGQGWSRSWEPTS